MTENSEHSSPATAVDRLVTVSHIAKWWLAEVGVHGYATRLVDGPHSCREDVEQAMFMFRSLGLGTGKKYCCAKVEESTVEAKPHDTNMDALAICKYMTDRHAYD